MKNGNYHEASMELSPDHLDEIDYWKEVCADSEDDPIHRVNSWTLTRVPIDDYGFTFDRRELGSGWVESEEDARDNRILEWVRRSGGWDNALRASPVIAILTVAGYDKVDGWHRLRLARLAGMSHVWCLVGALPI